MQFNYLATDKAGRQKKGSLDAVNIMDAKRQLVTEQNLFVSKIAPVKKVSKLTQLSIGSVSDTEKTLFAKHLAAMTKSGISLSEALDVIAEQSISPKLKKVSKKIAKEVRSGQQLSHSLRRYPKIFDQLFINIVKVGEESGTLEESLNYMVNDLEERRAMKQKVFAASIYPAIVLGATVILGLVLSYFVLPKVTGIITSVSVDIPITTRILLWVARVMESHGLIIIAGFIGGVILFRLFIELKPIKPLWVHFLLRLPILKNLIVDYNLALINRTLSTLLHSGLTVDRATQVTAETTQNVIYKKRLHKLSEEIKTGNPINVSLEQIDKRHKFFPLMMVKMISVGEKTGKLDDTYQYLSEYFGTEVENSTKNLSSVVEPALLIGIGLVVAFVALSIISPIYEITGQLRR